MGTGTVPTQATLVPLLASSPVDPSSLPSNSTFYWSDTSDPHFYSTGTDTPVVFPIVPSSTNSRNEFTILPRVTDLEAKEIRAISRLVDKLRPVDTIATISAGSNPRNELPILDVAATSSRFTVLRNVTGNSNID